MDDGSGGVSGHSNVAPSSAAGTRKYIRLIVEASDVELTLWQIIMHIAYRKTR